MIEESTVILWGGGVPLAGSVLRFFALLALDVKAMRLLKAHGAETNIPTRKIPERDRRRRDPQEEKEQEIDHSGLPEVPMSTCVMRTDTRLCTMPQRVAIIG